MKRSIFITFLTSVLFAGLLASLGAQEKNKGICFQPEDKEHEDCVDFKTSWYYAVPLSRGWVIYVRQVNSHALPFIWDKGQFLVSKEEWKKVESSLAAAGLPSVCPPPEFRQQEDRLKSRAELCKK